MIILTKRKLASKIGEIIAAVHDETDFEVEVQGYRDYGITPYATDKKQVTKTIYKILKEK